MRQQQLFRISDMQDVLLIIYLNNSINPIAIGNQKWDGGNRILSLN